MSDEKSCFEMMASYSGPKNNELKAVFKQTLEDVYWLLKLKKVAEEAVCEGKADDQLPVDYYRDILYRWWKCSEDMLEIIGD